MSTAKRRRLDNLETASTGSGRAAGSRGQQQQQQPQHPRYGGQHSASAAAASTVGNNGNGNGVPVDNPHYQPVLTMSSLPVAALSRYALHYGLIGPDPLTHAQATHPTPPLPLHLSLAAGNMALPRRRASLVPARKGDQDSAEAEAERGMPVDPDRQQSEDAAVAAAATSGEPDITVPPETAIDQPTEPSADKPLETGAEAEGKAKSSEPERAVTTLAGPSVSTNGAWTDPGEPDAPELRGMTAYEGGYEQFQEKIGALAKAHWEKYQTVKEGETIVNFAYAIRMRSKVLKSVPPP